MEPIQFILNYPKYLSEIDLVIRPEYKVIIDEMRSEDPHDFITPDSYLVSENQALGFVWRRFLSKVKKSNQFSSRDFK